MRTNNKNISSGLAHVLVFFLVMSPCGVMAQESRATDMLQPPLDVAAPDISPQEAEERLNDAKMLFDRGKTDAAIYMLQQLQKADPGNYKVLFKLGEMAIADRNWAYSITVLRKASFIRPEDIEVRLILMDIYKAYQMPLQSIVVAKEILALNPDHMVGNKRLADLYQEQAMLEDEILTRKKVRQLAPKDYDNLKRLAVIYSQSGDLWEAAIIYEEIRRFYPENNQDLSKLAGIYDQLGESFRNLEVIEQLSENGQSRDWLENRAVTKLRKQSDLHDPFYADVGFEGYKDDALKGNAFGSNARIAHLSLSSSIEFAGRVKLAGINIEGRNDLDGEFDINRGEVLVAGIKNWHGQDYQFIASLGVIHDEVNGRLFLRDPNSGVDPDDFPILDDPTFESYGGTMAIGGLKFIARPGLFASYQLAYERGQVEDLEARLQMLYFDKLSLAYSYESNDLTTVQASADVASISDDNVRTHALAGGSYVLWGSDLKRNLMGSRKSFFRNPPAQSISLGYTLEYFDDKELSNLYSIYENEFRHKGALFSQLEIYNMGVYIDRAVFLNLGYAYSTGDTLLYQHNVDARVFYINGDTGNEVGLTAAYEKSNVDEFSQLNQRRVGLSESYKIFLYANLRF